MDIKLFSSYLFIGFLIVFIRKLKPHMMLSTEYTGLLKSDINISHISNSTRNTTSYRESESSNISKSIEASTEGKENITISDETLNITDGLFNYNDLDSVHKVNYTKLGIEKLEEALAILNSGVWNFYKRTIDGDSIYTRKLPDGHTVLRLTGVLNVPAKELFFILHSGLEDYPKWNPSFLECRVLKKIDDHTDISYQVSAASARGYVSSRDFVTLRYWTKRDGNYISGTSSVNYSEQPENLDYTRGENGPGCWELRPMRSNPNNTEFRWLLNTKLNGWIPQLLADNAFKKFMAKYMVFLRQYCLQLKEKETEI